MESLTEIVYRANVLSLINDEEGKLIYRIHDKITVGDFNNTKWRLWIYEDALDFVSLFVQHLEIKEPVVAEYSFSICDKDGKVKRRKEKSVFRYQIQKDQVFQFGFKTFMSVSEMEDEQGIVIIRCRIKILGNPEAIGLPSKQSHDVWKSIRNDHATDVVVKVGDGRSIPCHKVALALRSTVFRAMLTNTENLESQSSSISAEYSFECMQKLIEYVYLGQESLDSSDKGLEGLLYELLFAADYYNIPSLKKWCENVLAKNLAADNVFTTLDAA